MSSEPTSTTSTTSSSSRPKRVVVPKVWKRPHSTIYGKNVEFGSSLYSDKIGEINGRKFNSELPWTMRNSGPSSSAGSGPSSYSQGYLSNLNNSLTRSDSRLEHGFNSGFNSSMKKYDFTGKPTSDDANKFVCLLDITNPNRLFARANQNNKENRGLDSNRRIDFYEQYGQFSQEIDQVQANSLLATDPLVRRRMFDDNLDFDYTIGIFVPKLEAESASSGRDPRSGRRPKPRITTTTTTKIPSQATKPIDMLIREADINHNLHNLQSPSPSQSHPQTTQPNSGYMLQLQPTHLHKPTPAQLEMHEHYGQFGIQSSPYGPSADGRKLSLGSINPHSYRPSLPAKTTTAHSSDGDEFEFHDRSSPFYTDRWAGKTIRHFDSDLYSNANLFKSMIL